MSAITWSNAIRDYLVTLGYPSATFATGVQDLVTLYTAAFPDVVKDVGLVAMLEKNFKDVLAVLKGVNDVYGFSAHVPLVTDSQVEAWIDTYRPDLLAMDDIIADAITINLVSNSGKELVPSAPLADPSTSTTTSEAQRYQMAAEEMLRQVIAWMRHFVTVDQTYGDSNSQNYGKLETPKFPPSTLPGVSEFDYRKNNA